MAEAGLQRSTSKSYKGEVTLLLEIGNGKWCILPTKQCLQ